MLHWAREIYIHFLEHAFRKAWKKLKKTRIFMLIFCFLDFLKSWNLYAFPYIFYVDRLLFGHAFWKKINSLDFRGFSMKFYVDCLLFGHAFWKKLTADIWMDFQCNFMLIVCFLKIFMLIFCFLDFMLFIKNLCWFTAFWILLFYKNLCWFHAFWSCFLKKFLCWFHSFWILCFLKIYFLIFLLSGRSTPPLYTCKIISLTYL